MKRSRLQGGERYLYSTNSHTVEFPTFQQVTLVSTEEIAEAGVAGNRNGLRIEETIGGRAVQVKMRNATLGYLDAEPCEATGWRNMRKAVLPIHLWATWEGCAEVVSRTGFQIMSEFEFTSGVRALVNEICYIDNLVCPTHSPLFDGDLWERHGILWRWFHTAGEWQPIKVGQRAEEYLTHLTTDGADESSMEAMETLERQTESFLADERRFLEEIYPPHNGTTYTERYISVTSTRDADMQYHFEWNGDYWVIQNWPSDFEDVDVERWHRVLRNIQLLRTTPTAGLTSAVPRNSGFRTTGGTLAIADEGTPMWNEGGTYTRRVTIPTVGQADDMYDSMRYVWSDNSTPTRMNVNTGAWTEPIYDMSAFVGQPDNVFDATGDLSLPYEYRPLGQQAVAAQTAIRLDAIEPIRPEFEALIRDIYPPETSRAREMGDHITTFNRIAHSLYWGPGGYTPIPAGTLWRWGYDHNRRQHVLVAMLATLAAGMHYVDVGRVANTIEDERYSSVNADFSRSWEYAVSVETAFEERTERDNAHMTTTFYLQGSYTRQTDNFRFTAGQSLTITDEALMAAVTMESVMESVRLRLRESVVRNIVQQIRESLVENMLDPQNLRVGDRFRTDGTDWQFLGNDVAGNVDQQNPSRQDQVSEMTHIAQVASEAAEALRRGEDPRDVAEFFESEREGMQRLREDTWLHRLDRRRNPTTPELHEERRTTDFHGRGAFCASEAIRNTFFPTPALEIRAVPHPELDVGDTVTITGMTGIAPGTRLRITDGGSRSQMGTVNAEGHIIIDAPLENTAMRYRLNDPIGSPWHDTYRNFSIGPSTPSVTGASEAMEHARAGAVEAIGRLRGANYERVFVDEMLDFTAESDGVAADADNVVTPADQERFRRLMNAGHDDEQPPF